MKIEFILKPSSVYGLVDNWVASGREAPENEMFIFECDSYERDAEIFTVHANGSTYIYNVFDFYRIKIMKEEE